MKVKLENREYELKANGGFMLKYQTLFGGNVIETLYNCIQKKDILECAKLCYCAIDETMTFEEWLNSFETPLFILAEMDSILNYLIRSVEPTVAPKPNGDEKGSGDSKKKIN